MDQYLRERFQQTNYIVGLKWPRVAFSDVVGPIGRYTSCSMDAWYTSAFKSEARIEQAGTPSRHVQQRVLMFSIIRVACSSEG